MTISMGAWIWCLLVYTVGCALHAYVARRALNKAWEVREGVLTMTQLLRLDWYGVRLLVFVLLWPGVVIAVITYGSFLALREMYSEL